MSGYQEAVADLMAENGALRAVIGKLREALKPFAAFAELIDSSSASRRLGDPSPLTLDLSKINDGAMASLGDCRRARDALADGEKE